jgi:hypothetical protein
VTVRRAKLRPKDRLERLRVHSHGAR